MKVKDIVNQVKIFTKKNSPEILTGLGIAGMVTTTILAVKATPKAIQLIEKEEECKGEPLTAPEKVKTCWKCYVPAVISGAGAVACIVGARNVNAKRNAALTAAYQLSQTALSEYKEKVVETIGEKKEKVVRQNITQDKIDKKPVSSSEVIVTEKGNTLFFEPLSGRYFKSDIESIKRVINELNRRMVGGEQYISLSEFYIEIGLSTTQISDELGWRVDRCLIEADFPAMKADDGTPCLSIDFLVLPEYAYQTMF